MKKSDESEEATRATVDRSIEKLRFDRLVPYAKARNGDLTDENGEPIYRDLVDDLPTLTAELEVGADWIKQRVAEIAAIGWQHATTDDFVKGRSDGGRGKSRLAPELLEALIESVEFACGEHHLKPGKTEAITTAISRLIEKHKAPEEKIPARTTISMMMHSAIGWAAYAGPYRHDHENRPGLERRKADALLSCVMLDWTGLSQDHRELIVVTDDFLEVGRANLISAIDEASRAPWGWMWCVGAPNSELITECVSNGLLEKTHLMAQAGVTGKYPISGRPLILRHDNGRDMEADNTERVVRECGIRFDECSPPNTPHYNGIQERFQGTAKRMFLDFVTAIKVHKKSPAGLKEKSDPEKDYPKEKKTTLASSRIFIRWDELQKYWLRWILEVYCLNKHKGIDQFTPLQRHTQLVRGEGYHFAGIRKPLIDSIDHRWRFLSVKPVHNFRGTVIIHRREYSSYELNQAVNFTGRTRRAGFEVRYDRYDLSEIYYKSSTGIIAVPLRKPAELPRCSHWEWQAAVKDLQRVDLLNPPVEEVARLIRARKKKLENPGPYDQTIITKADRVHHLMHCVMRDRFKKELDRVKARSTAETTCRPPGTPPPTLDLTLMPKIGRRRAMRNTVKLGEIKLPNMRKRRRTL